MGRGVKMKIARRRTPNPSKRRQGGRIKTVGNPPKGIFASVHPVNPHPIVIPKIRDRMAVETQRISAWAKKKRAIWTRVIPIACKVRS
jgi:hypothetical protein